MMDVNTLVQSKQTENIPGDDDGGGYDVDDYYFDYGDKDQRNGGNLFPSLVLPTMMMIMDIMIMMMISLK